jgi:DNA modification methylase
VRIAREDADEKHLCPLQLDVIDRGIQLRTNPGDAVLTPFAGVGSEVAQAVEHRRYGIGIELKEAYYRQAAATLKRIEGRPVQNSFLEAA